MNRYTRAHTARSSTAHPSTDALIERATQTFTRYSVRMPRQPTARGTRELAPELVQRPGPVIVVPTYNTQALGTNWFYSLRLEQLGRNLATAGGLALAYRLGLMADEFARAANRGGS